MPYTYSNLIRRAYRGEVAHRHVTAISQHHRIQASPGFRAAAEYVAGQLAAAGLQTTICRYPADGAARFWTTPSFLEWACDAATLHLLDDGAEASGAPAELLCDFAAVPISVIQRSIPVEGEFDVVALPGKGGKEPGDYDGADVRGKIVLTSEAVARVAELAVRERGAAGILFDGMTAGGRTELDLPDARQYTSFWWAGEAPPDAWGFVVSPRQGKRLRTRLAEGKPVRVAAAIQSRFYAGSFEVVDAFIPGATDEEILLVSHLCHPLPGAHDNGSGAGALIETAVTVARLISEGKLPPPKRGIRFLWPPEMTGTFAWLAAHEADVRRGRWIAGLNLDMVGADQRQTGSAWQLVSLPQAGAAFADHLLSWLREPFVAGQRVEETPFSAGSDHYILADPTVGIPTPMLIQWPDTFYHTSADTADKVSPDSLAGSGALAAVYAYWLATAGPAEARWLAHLMVSRFAAQASKSAVAAVESAETGDDAARARSFLDYHRRVAFDFGRVHAALASLRKLDPTLGEEITGWGTDVANITNREDEWVRVTLGVDDRHMPPLVSEPWRAEAAKLFPRRLHPGPIDLGMVLQTMSTELRQAFWKLNDEGGAALYDSAALMQYWADGAHSVADIAFRVAFETNKPVSELTLKYFKLLAQTGLVELTNDE
ncbi:MAG: DUF4910 domain-containing protein [Chloroflexi bacterium]|nr:DUF4910 domain-containing protein [Chloroflexota bacterium]